MPPVIIFGGGFAAFPRSCFSEDAKLGGGVAATLALPTCTAVSHVLAAERAICARSSLRECSGVFGKGDHRLALWRLSGKHRVLIPHRLTLGWGGPSTYGLVQGFV
jgi:hypothetical protein